MTCKYKQCVQHKSSSCTIGKCSQCKPHTHTQAGMKKVVSSLDALQFTHVQRNLYHYLLINLFSVNSYQPPTNALSHVKVTAHLLHFYYLFRYQVYHQSRVCEPVKKTSKE